MKKIKRSQKTFGDTLEEIMKKKMIIRKIAQRVMRERKNGEEDKEKKC